MSKENTKRIPYFDNVKGLLITLVVLGHIIEPFLYIHSLDFIYILIYFILNIVKSSIHV